MTAPVTVTQADADVAQAIVSSVRGYGVKFGHPATDEPEKGLG